MYMDTSYTGPTERWKQNYNMSNYRMRDFALYHAYHLSMTFKLDYDAEYEITFSWFR